MADERVLDFVSDIYEAALDATRWPAVQNSGGDAVGGPTVVYGLYDPASALAQIYAPRVDPEHVRRFDDWIGRVPALPCIGNYAPGQVFSGSDVVMAEDFVRTDFYRECWLPTGLSTTPLVTNLQSGDATSGHVATHAPANASFSDDQRRLFEALARHLVHAASLQRCVHHLDLGGPQRALQPRWPQSGIRSCRYRRKAAACGASRDGCRSTCWFRLSSRRSRST